MAPKSNSTQKGIEFKKRVLVTTVQEVAASFSSRKLFLQVLTLQVEALNEVGMQALNGVGGVPRVKREVLAYDEVEVGILLLLHWQSLVVKDGQ